MKRIHKRTKHNYNKFPVLQDSSTSCLYYAEYMGLFMKKGRTYIDTKRWIKVMKYWGKNEFIFEGMNKNRNTPYLLPKFKYEYDYQMNIFIDYIINLREDWYNEYKPLFDKIITPKEVFEKSRLNQLMFTSSSDDIDEIEIDARFDQLRRYDKYNQIITSLYCQVIQYISAQIDRMILMFLHKRGFPSKQYDFKEFRDFSKQILKKQNKKYITLEELPGYNDLYRMRVINNFLKHNSIDAYNKLKGLNASYVIKDVEYENGMYAAYFINLEENYIENLFSKLIDFFKSYCVYFLGEDEDDARWNYDEFFRRAYHEMKYNPVGF